MTRIQWATTSTGTAAYTFPYNPTSISLDDSINKIITPCIGSESVSYLKPYDARPISFTWNGWGSNHVAFSGMINVLVSGIDTKKYFKWNDIQYMFRNVMNITGWQGPYRIENIIPTLGDGGWVWTDVKMIIHRAT